MTKIEWAEEVWNPTVGCTIVDHRCTHCYAMRDAYRKQFNPNAKIRSAYEGTVKLANGFPVWTGRVNLLEDRLSIPLRKRKPTTYFVDSMSDLFHPNVPDEFIDRVFAVMALCPKHRFIVLTKRSERMVQYFGPSEELGGMTRDVLVEGTTQNIHHERTGEDPSMWLAVHWPLPNVILGVSASDQATLDAAAPHLLRTPTVCRVLSLEPLLGPITHMPVGIPRVDWVIVGGESGPGARFMHPDWARSIRDQCQAAGVPFFFKQWGEYLPDNQNPALSPPHAASGAIRVGKKAAGRLLDGREWNELPEVLR